jgi:glycosyltransferase involved in cell wall biosynthesis
MKILVVSQYFWPENFRINEVAQTLAGKGVDVEVLTGQPNYPEGVVYPGYRAAACRREQHDKILIHRVPLAPRGKNSGLRLAVNYLSFIFAGLTFGLWQLRGRRYDVIFAHGTSPILQAIPAIFIAWLKRCPVVLWVQDLWPESLSATGYVTNKKTLRFVERLVCYIYRHVDLLLVQSEAFVAPVSAMASGTPVKYYPNSVDERFSVPTRSAVLDVSGLDRRFPVLFAGNIGTAQAVEVIVEAASLLREHEDIHFVVVGDGSRRDWMLGQVRSRSLTNLHLPGRFPLDTMPGIMQRASALLVTLADQPIFAATVPNKIQAYMATGRPIIASVRGEGARLVTAAKAGLAVLPQDGAALADAVLRLYGMPASERDALGRNGQRYFMEHFDHDMLIERLITQLQATSQQGASVR